MLQSPFTVFNCALEPAGRQRLHSLEKRLVFTLGEEARTAKKDPSKVQMFLCKRKHVLLGQNMTQQLNESQVFTLVKNAKCLVNNRVAW